MNLLVLTILQSIVFLAVLVAVCFFFAGVATNAVRRSVARDEEARRVSLAYLMAQPEPAAAPTAHLRLVWSQREVPVDEPYDQMKDIAL